jgi:hypothetical protein
MSLSPFTGAARKDIPSCLSEKRTDTGREERRVALIIGNNKYKGGNLKNPCNDAEDMASSLKSFGFQVDLRLNADLKTTQDAINSFISSLRPETVGLFYFAGHGIQLDGENYLIPTDFDAKDEPTAKRVSFSASVLNERLEESGTRLSIIILDACRNNPYRSLFRGLKTGLAAMYSGNGSIIAFATGPGKMASDNDEERNGLFTKHLLESLKESPSCLDEVFARTRARVVEAKKDQVPSVTTSVIGRFCFKEPEEIREKVNDQLISSEPPPLPQCKAISIPDSSPFYIDGQFEPSGIMGDIGDVQIKKLEKSTQFRYSTNGKGPHEWDYKYVNGELNPKPAQFGGVMYLSPPNNFGNVCGGLDLSPVRRVIKWEARSLKGNVIVEFIIGGVRWAWKDKTTVTPPYPDSMPRTPLVPRKLTPEWQTFEFDLSKLQPSDFTRVINGFSWVINWGSNDVNPNDDGTGPERPKTFEIEIRNIRYER